MTDTNGAPAPDGATVSDANSANNILTIPPELFERIAELSSPEDLPSLRLVNRECVAKVLRTYTKGFFGTSGYLICNNVSLRQLLSITRHEQFGRAIRTLVLCVDELPQEINSRYWDFRTNPAASKDDTMRGHMKRVQQGSGYLSCLRQQEDFIRQEADLCLLTTIFAQLRRIGNHVNLTITCVVNAKTPVCGWKSLEEDTGESLILHQLDPRPIRIIMNALALSGMEPRVLNIIGCSWEWYLYDLVKEEQLRRATTDVFANLTEAYLFWSADSQCPDKDVLQTVLLLANAPRLRKLELSIMAYHIDEVPGTTELFVKSLLSLKFLALTHLDLSFFRICYEDIALFAVNNPKLETLWIDCGEISGFPPEDYAVKYEEAEKEYSWMERKLMPRIIHVFDKVVHSSCNFDFEYDEEDEFEDDEDGEGGPGENDHADNAEDAVEQI